MVEWEYNNTKFRADLINYNSEYSLADNILYFLDAHLINNLRNYFIDSHFESDNKNKKFVNYFKYNCFLYKWIENITYLLNQYETIETLSINDKENMTKLFKRIIDYFDNNNVIEKNNFTNLAREFGLDDILHDLQQKNNIDRYSYNDISNIILAYVKSHIDSMYRNYTLFNEVYNVYGIKKYFIQKFRDENIYKKNVKIMPILYLIIDDSKNLLEESIKLIENEISKILSNIPNYNDRLCGEKFGKLIKEFSFTSTKKFNIFDFKKNEKSCFALLSIEENNGYKDYISLSGGKDYKDDNSNIKVVWDDIIDKINKAIFNNDAKRAYIRNATRRYDVKDITNNNLKVLFNKNKYLTVDDELNAKGEKLNKQYLGDNYGCCERKLQSEDNNIDKNSIKLYFCRWKPCNKCINSFQYDKGDKYFISLFNSKNEEYDISVKQKELKIMLSKL